MQGRWKWKDAQDISDMMKDIGSFSYRASLEHKRLILSGKGPIMFPATGIG